MHVVSVCANPIYAPSDPPAYREEIARHHERVGQLLTAIQEVIDARASERESPTLATALLALLVDLDHELPIHFEAEEHAGYFADVLRVAPEMSLHIDRLKQDHIDFSDRAHALLACACQAGEGERPWGDVDRLFAEFEDRLSRHEHNENDILRHLYMLDTGHSG